MNCLSYGIVPLLHVATSKLLILECDFISTLAKRDPMPFIQSELVRLYLYGRYL